MTTRAAIAMSLGLAVPFARGADAPFGHRDFAPSPTMAVGFAGQGNNWYPGATPPTEWWEGTPTTSKVLCEAGRRDRYLSLSGPYAKEQSVKAYADNNSKNILTVEDRKPLIPLMKEVVAGLEGRKKNIGAAFPEGVAAMDAQIVEYRAGMVVTNMEQAGKFRLEAFPKWSMKITGVDVGNCWPGYISDTMATPVCDGAILGVTMGHGQVAAYDLAAGKRLWAFRDPTMNAHSVSHAPSPMMWKDLFIITAGGGAKGAPTLLALDKRIGAVRWESPGGAGGCRIGGSHGDHMSHHLMRLPDVPSAPAGSAAASKGGVRALIVTNKGAVLDAETGKELVAKLPGSSEKNGGNWGSGFIACVGDRVFKTWGGDCSAPPCETWQLRLATANQIEVETLPTLPFSKSHAPFALSDKALILGGKGGDTTLDPLTGREMGKAPGGTSTIAGKYLIQANNQVGDNGRNRQDNMCLISFTVVDISDPAHPRVVSDKSLLGTDKWPCDIADTYFPAIARNPALKKLTVAGYHGVSPLFGVRMGGVTAHGSRLYILSHTDLYCIGGK